jgi:hypothetical protein
MILLVLDIDDFVSCLERFLVDFLVADLRWLLLLVLGMVKTANSFDITELGVCGDDFVVLW